MDAYWQAIPNDTDILITHTPPHGILDTTSRRRAVGCEMLRQRMRDLTPRLHLFGHIHASYGQQKIGPTLFANGSYMSKGNPAMIFDW